MFCADDTADSHLNRACLQEWRLERMQRHLSRRPRRRAPFSELRQNCVPRLTTFSGSPCCEVHRPNDHEELHLDVCRSCR